MTAAAAVAGGDLRAALAQVVDRKDLSADEMAAVVGRIMDGEATPAQVGALLAALDVELGAFDSMPVPGMGAQMTIRDRVAI